MQATLKKLYFVFYFFEIAVYSCDRLLLIFPVHQHAIKFKYEDAFDVTSVVPGICFFGFFLSVDGLRTLS